MSANIQSTVAQESELVADPLLIAKSKTDQYLLPKLANRLARRRRDRHRQDRHHPRHGGAVRPDRRASLYGRRQG